LGALSTSAQTVDAVASETKPPSPENVERTEVSAVATETPAIKMESMKEKIESSTEKSSQYAEGNSEMPQNTENTGQAISKRDPEDLSGLNYIFEETEKKFESGLPSLDEASKALDALGKSAESLVIPEDAIKAEPELLKAEEEEKLQQKQEQRQIGEKQEQEEHQQHQKLQTSSLRSGENGVVNSVNNVNSIHHGGSKVSLQGREENEEWYDAFGEYKFDMVSTPTRWLELNLCSYDKATGATTVGATSMIPLDVCHLSAYHRGKSMTVPSSNHDSGHYVSYKANITTSGLLSIFYDYDCNDDTTRFNATLQQDDFFGHINTTDSCSLDSVNGNPMYSAKIHHQTTIPSPPSYNGRLEKWYSDNSCSSMSGWNFVKSDTCIQDKSRMIFTTNNPSGYPFYVSGTDGTGGSGGEIVSFSAGGYTCVGSNSSESRTLGTFRSCTSGLAVLKDNLNYTVMGEIGLGSHFESDWLPPLDEATMDAVDITLTGDVDALSALMDSKGVEFLMKNNLGATAASISSVKGNLDTIKLLVTRGGVSVDAIGDTGNSMLTWAAGYGKVDVVNYLIAQNADLNVKNNDGKSALMLAYEKGYKSIANALLAAGASVF